MQERLIKNKTLLTAIEPAISCTSLEVSGDDDWDGVEDIDDEDGDDDDDDGVDDGDDDDDDDHNHDDHDTDSKWAGYLV